MAGKRAADVYPSLELGVSDRCATSRSIRRRQPDSTSCSWASRTTASMALAPQLVGSVGCIVDLSAAYRLKDPAHYPTLLRLRTHADRPARRCGVRPSRTAPRRTRRRQADRHAGVPRHGGDAGAASAGGAGRDQAVRHRGRHRDGNHRCRTDADRHQRVHQRRLQRRSPTGC